MRMIIQALPFTKQICNCILYHSDGKYTSANYYSDIGMSTHDGIGSWDYDFLLKYINTWLLGQL